MPNNPRITVLDKRKGYFLVAKKHTDNEGRPYVELSAGCSWGELDAAGALRLAAWLEYWGKHHE